MISSMSFKASFSFRNILLGGSIRILPGRNFARYILMQFILFSLIVRTGYQGVQFDLMLKVRLLTFMVFGF
jgi:hypothetical protein